LRQSACESNYQLTLSFLFALTCFFFALCLDHFDTALAIAKQIGIYSEANGDRAMNGDALAVLTEEQLAALDPFPVVFSRVSPDNKLKLVKSLQRRGEVAAMTGDGGHTHAHTQKKAKTDAHVQMSTHPSISDRRSLFPFCSRRGFLMLCCVCVCL